MTAERRRVYFQRPDRCRESHAEHERIFDAIARRNAVQAMDLMDAHLKGVESYWQGLLDWLQEHVLSEGAIAPQDLKLMTLTDDPEEAAEMATRPLPIRVSDRPREQTGEPKADAR